MNDKETLVKVEEALAELDERVEEELVNQLTTKSEKHYDIVFDKLMEIIDPSFEDDIVPEKIACVLAFEAVLNFMYDIDPSLKPWQTKYT